MFNGATAVRFIYIVPGEVVAVARFWLTRRHASSPALIQLLRRLTDGLSKVRTG